MGGPSGGIDEVHAGADLGCHQPSCEGVSPKVGGGDPSKAALVRSAEGALTESTFGAQHETTRPGLSASRTAVASLSTTASTSRSGG